MISNQLKITQITFSISHYYFLHCSFVYSSIIRLSIFLLSHQRNNQSTNFSSHLTQLQTPPIKPPFPSDSGPFQKFFANTTRNRSPKLQNRLVNPVNEINAWCRQFFPKLGDPVAKSINRGHRYTSKRFPCSADARSLAGSPDRPEDSPLKQRAAVRSRNYVPPRRSPAMFDRWTFSGKFR